MTRNGGLLTSGANWTVQERGFTNMKQRGCRQPQDYRILRQAERQRAGMERNRNRLIGCLQLDSYEFMNAAFDARKPLATSHRDQVVQSALVASTRVVYAIMFAVKIFEGL